MSFIKEYWFLIWAGVLTIAQLGNLLLSKTFAKKEEVEALKRELSEVNIQLNHLPSKEEVARLRVELETTRGEIKALTPQLEQIKNLTQLLLEQQLDK